MFMDYGPIQDEKKEGDFNLIRRVDEKSTGNVDQRFMDVFHEMIEAAELTELFRGGCKYTWTNK